MTGMSGAVKNMFGVVPGLMKPELHCRFPDKRIQRNAGRFMRGRTSAYCDYGRCYGYGRQRPFRRKTKVYRNLNRRNQSLCGRYGLRLYNLVKTFRHFYACFCYGTRPLSKTVEEIEILGLPLSDTVISDFLPPQSKSSDFIQYLPSF